MASWKNIQELLCWFIMNTLENPTCNLVFTTSKGQVNVAPTVPPTLQNNEKQISHLL